MTPHTAGKSASVIGVFQYELSLVWIPTPGLLVRVRQERARPIALGRANWLFAESLRAGKRAAAVMSLLHSARIKGHDRYAYRKDVSTRLPWQPNSRIQELLPHRWTPAS